MNEGIISMKNCLCIRSFHESQWLLGFALTSVLHMQKDGLTSVIVTQMNLESCPHLRSSSSSPSFLSDYVLSFYNKYFISPFSSLKSIH